MNAFRTGGIDPGLRPSGARLAEIAIYGLSSEAIENSELVVEGKGIFRCVHNSQWPHADRDCYISFIHNPNLPLAASALYRRRRVG